MGNINLDEFTSYNLFQAISERAIEDYCKAKYSYLRCKSHKCKSCKNPLGDSCENVMESVKDFFNGDMFATAYPNIDAKWVLKQIDERAAHYTVQ